MITQGIYLLIGLFIVMVIMRIFLDFLDYMRIYRYELEQEESVGKDVK